jgi:anti-sigma factor RsiW
MERRLETVVQARLFNEIVMIISLPDELIMAFVDGELEPRAAARVRTALMNDEEFRRKHEIYRTTRSVMARSFAPIAAEPVPERLKRAVAKLNRHKR